MIQAATVEDRRGPPDGAGQAVWVVVRFGLCTLLLSVLFSLLAIPFVTLTWLQVIRRCVSVAAAVSVWICLVKLEKRTFASFGLSPLRAGGGQLLGGVLLGSAGLGLMLAVGLLSGACEFDIHPDAAKLWGTLLGFIPAALLVGVLEEVVFRGLILQHLMRVSAWGGIVASSGLYAIVHLKQAGLSLESSMELAGLFLLGVVLAAGYLLTGRLWLSIGLHAALAYGARVNKLVIAFSDPSMSWLVGTSRLINGLSAWVALAGIAVVIWRWTAGSDRGDTRHVFQ